MTTRARARAVKDLYPSELKVEWKRLGRRAMRLWKATGGLDPEIDLLFKRMDAVDRAMARVSRRRQLGASTR